ncbi:unnamed protein product [Clonostachys rosea]|uniref:Uncharacterized protein n=1 Tax=Bionectria ochroleuca TaxID=29856 RepID=A0ABY6U4P8_BIOOC|nr:unnamed protein product [Clonostachys rosea]
MTVVAVVEANFGQLAYDLDRDTQRIRQGAPLSYIMKNSVAVGRASYHAEKVVVEYIMMPIVQNQRRAVGFGEGAT